MSKRQLMLAEDINSLAKSWERLIASVDYPSKRFALTGLYTICNTFLRGRGMRIKLPLQLRTEGMTAALLVHLVLSRVANEEDRETIFPALSRMGFRTMGDALQWIEEDTRRTFDMPLVEGEDKD